MSNPARAVTLGLAAAAAAVAGLVVASWLFGPHGPGHQEVLASGTLLPTPRVLPDFKLTDQDGQPFDKARFAGRWSVVFIGFTHCPDVCPTTLALLRGVHAKLAEEKKSLQVVFLSVDPARDTPAQLGQYVHSFDPSFVGVTAPDPDLEKLGSAMGFVYEKVPGPTPDTYSMDHSALLTVVNPDAQVAAYLSPPFKPDLLTRDLGTLVPAAKG